MAATLSKYSVYDYEQVCFVKVLSIENNPPRQGASLNTLPKTCFPHNYQKDSENIFRCLSNSTHQFQGLTCVMLCRNLDLAGVRRQIIDVVCGLLFMLACRIANS